MNDDTHRDLPLDERPSAAELQEVSIRCPNCGYNLTGVRLGSSCPECNLIIGRGVLGGGAQPTSGYAVASLVLGICSITIGCVVYGLLSAILGPLALFCAAKAGKQIRAGGVSASSHGLKTAGFVTGLIGTIVGAFVVILLVGFLLLAAANVSSSGGQSHRSSPAPVVPTPAPAMVPAGTSTP